MKPKVCSANCRSSVGTEELVLQPWFLSKTAARKMRNLLPPDFRKRLRDMFEDYGCLRCDRKDVPYRSNGMCDNCMMTVFHRIHTSEYRRSKERMEKRYGKDLVFKERAAKRLLGEFSELAGKRRRRARKIIDLGSPVAAAFETVQ